MRVVVLHDELSPDARPDELDALVQANVVTHALRELGHEPSLADLATKVGSDEKRLGRFVTDRGKIVPRRVSGTCSMHQKQLTTAIKRARTASPY